MKNKIKISLHNWILSLNSLIGDTTREINKRKESNLGASYLRDDLKSLLEYMEKNDLPENVYRALNHCFEWNPHAKTNKNT